MDQETQEARGEAGTSQQQVEYGDAINLFGVIDRDKVNGLNLTVPEDAKEVIKSWDQRESTENYIDSGVDDQLILNVPFTQSVRIRSILLKVGRGGMAPRRLRFYANRPTGVGFDEAEVLKPQLDIALLDGETSVTEYPLRVAVFSNVFSISLFFSESSEEETSRVYYVGFKGDARQPKKDTNTTLEVRADQASQAKLSGRVAEDMKKHLQIR